MQIGGVSAKQAYVPPAPIKTPLEIEMEARAAVSDFWLWVLIKWGFGLTALAATLWAVVRFLVVPSSKIDREIRTDESGLYPVIREWVPDTSKPWYVRPFAPKKLIMNDPNTAMAPDRLISVADDGALNINADLHGFDTDQQLRFARGRVEVQKTSGMNAKGKIQRIPGGAGKKSQADYMQEAGVFEARSAEAKMKRLTAETNLQNAQIRQQRLIEGPAKGSAEEIEESIPQVEYMSFREALDQSTKTNWILGQATLKQPNTSDGVNQSVNGQIVAFNPSTDRIAVLGGSGSGKTESTGLSLVAMARKTGFHVLLFDGKNGVDWSEYDGVVEWYDLEAANLKGYVDQVFSIYQERLKYLQDNPSLKTIFNDKTARYQPILALFEEWGDVYSNFCATHKKKEVDDLQLKIDTLYRKGRMTGIVLGLIDQSPQRWSPQMRGNTSLAVVYRINGSVAAEFKEYHCQQLGVGYFSNNNIFYKAWHTAKEIEIRAEFGEQPIRILNKVENTWVDSEDESNDPADAAKPNRSVKSAKNVMEPITPEPIIERREPVTEVEYSLQRIYDRDKNMKHKKWQAFVRQYVKLADKFPEDHPMRKYPVAEIADRMAVCELGRYDKDLSDRRKSQASQWYSKIMAERQVDQPEVTIDGMSMSEWQEIPV